MPTPVTDLADLHRCKSVTPTGQCTNTAEYGLEYCEAHRKRTGLLMSPAVREYALTNLEQAARIAHFADPENLKSLKETLASLKWLLEKFLVIAGRSETELRATSGHIEKLVKTIANTIKLASDLEKESDVIFTREQLYAVTKEYIKAMQEEFSVLPGWEEPFDRTIEKMAQIATNKKSPSTPDDAR